MSYALIEDSLKDLLITIDGLGENNIAKNDFSVLNYGFEKYVVFEYGGLNPEAFSAGYTQKNVWVINIFICVHYIDDVQVREELNALRQLIMDKIQAWPRFNSALVFDANIVSGRPLPPNLNEDGDANFFWEVLECRAEELSRMVISG